MRCDYRKVHGGRFFVRLLFGIILISYLSLSVVTIVRLHDVQLPTREQHGVETGTISLDPDGVQHRGKVRSNFIDVDHVPSSPRSDISGNDPEMMERLSSVDYYACCGLGHRLIRMASANFLARRLGFDFRVFWGYCRVDKKQPADNQQPPGAEGNHTATTMVETFSQLFRPLDKGDMMALSTTMGSVRSLDQVLPVYYDVKPGYQPLRRGNYDHTRGINRTRPLESTSRTEGNDEPSRRRHPRLEEDTCPCRQDEIDSNVEFYRSLRRRFRFGHLVDRFRLDHGFHNHTVIGIHIRAGNGEQGDFVTKGRNILGSSMPPLGQRRGLGGNVSYGGTQNGTLDAKRWVQEVVDRLQSYLDSAFPPTAGNDVPWMVFVASDTPSIFGHFQEALMGLGIPVIEYKMQTRLEEGSGVWFGEVAHPRILERRTNASDNGTTFVVTDGGGGTSDCLTAWRDALMDMFLLSYCDLVIAGMPSTFVQSAPMSLAMAAASRTRRTDGTWTTKAPLPHSYCEVVPSSANDLTNDGTSTLTEPVKLECFRTFLDWCCKAPRSSVERHLLVQDPTISMDQLLRRLKSRGSGYQSTAHGTSAPPRGTAQVCPRPPPDVKRFTRYCLPHVW